MIRKIDGFGLHTLSYLVVMTLAAWLIYRKLGLVLLRAARFNLDWFWGGALVVAVPSL